MLAPTAAIVARTSTKRFAILFGGVLLVWELTRMVIPGQSWADSLASSVLIAIGAAIGLTFRLASQRARKLEDLVSQHEHDRNDAINAERRQIARELHDVVAHGLTIIAMHARVLDTAGGDQQRKHSQQAIGDASRQALQDLRRMLDALRGSEVAEPSSDPDEASGDLRRRIDEFAGQLRAAGIQADVDLPSDLELPRSLELTAIRIAQEATTNIIKHAPGCQHASFSVVRTPDELVLTVTNSPAQQPALETAPAQSGFGIAGLRERVHLFGGAFEAGPHKNDWRVHAALPLH